MKHGPGDYKDPNSLGNRIRPGLMCIECHSYGCITAWGPWCFQCNVDRLDRIHRNLEEMLSGDELTDSEKIIHAGDINSFCKKYSL